MHHDRITLFVAQLHWLHHFFGQTRGLKANDGLRHVRMRLSVDQGRARSSTRLLNVSIESPSEFDACSVLSRHLVSSSLIPAER